MVSEWPVFEEEFDFKAEENEVEMIKNAVRNIRNLRADMNVPPVSYTHLDVYKGQGLRESVRRFLFILKASWRRRIAVLKET